MINMKNLIKISIIIAIILIIVLKSISCYAATDILGDLNQYDPRNQQTEEEEIKNRTGIILAVIRTVGIIISVISLMIIGIKTITGSAEEKSEYKQRLPGYVLGVILVATVTTLPAIIYNITSNL